MIRQIRLLPSIDSGELFALDLRKLVAGYRFKRSIGFNAQGNTVYDLDGVILLGIVQRCKSQVADAVPLVGLPKSVDIGIKRCEVLVGMMWGRLQVSISLPTVLVLS